MLEGFALLAGGRGAEVWGEGGGGGGEEGGVGDFEEWGWEGTEETLGFGQLGAGWWVLVGADGFHLGGWDPGSEEVHFAANVLRDAQSGCEGVDGAG